MANSQINELVDYIKKAKQAGQSDEQTRQILMKNGWSVAETDEAFAVIAPADKPQPQPKPQQPQVQQQPQQTQPKAQPQAQPQPQYQLAENKRGGSHVVLKIIIVLIILAILGGGGYFVATQTNLLKTFMDTFFWKEIKAPVVENEITKTPQPSQLNLATAKLVAVLPEYDISKGVVASLFSKAGDKVAYCATHKTSKKIDCFLNDEKLSNSYSYNPYWIGVSPDGKRAVFLYFDALKKQSFVFENGAEIARYDGTVTSPSFSNDSQSFMYAVLGKDGKQFVVLNGSAKTLHDRIYGAPLLSSDGRYLLYGARDGQDIFWVADEVK